MDVVTTIGVDAHSQVHVAAAVVPQGRIIAERGITASTQQLVEFVEWMQSLPGPRQVAIEGAKGYGRTLTQQLLAAGETVVDVATGLTAEGRRRSRRPGKDDEGDAVVIARVALREPDLPQMNLPISTRTCSCSSVHVHSSSTSRHGSGTVSTRCCWA